MAMDLLNDDNLNSVFSQMTVGLLNIDKSAIANDTESAITAIQLMIQYIDEFITRMKSLKTSDKRFSDTRK